MKPASFLLLVLILVNVFVIASSVDESLELDPETFLQAQTRLLWANLTASQVNSSFPYSKRGSSSWTDDAEATFLGGAILALQTGKTSYLQKPDELCDWLNSTDTRKLFHRFQIASNTWSTSSTTSYAATRLAELAIYADLAHQWKPLLQEITSVFISRYVSSTNRVYMSIGYDGSVISAAAGAHETSASVIALTLSARTLMNESVRETAFQLIMQYPLGAANLPYHQVNQDGSPRLSYCKEDESFGLYVLAMETYYYNFPNLDIKNRINEVVQAGYRYMWNNAQKRWNYRTDADTGAPVWTIAVHGFGYTDEAFLQAYLICGNATWLDRMKSDMDTMILKGAIISNGLIAHDTTKKDDANDHWSVGARRTLTLFYALNRSGFHRNSTYLAKATTLFLDATRAHGRSKGWQITVHPSDYSDYTPRNTRVQLSKWLQFVNNTEATIDTLDDVYKYFGAPTLGNVQGLVPTTWVVDDDGSGDYQTIQEALDSARAEDMIYIRSGLYSELLSIMTPIVLIGEDVETTIIDADYTGSVIEIKASNVNVSTVTIQNSAVGTPAIRLKNVEACNILGINVLDSDIGIHIDASSATLIAGNTIAAHNIGIMLNASTNNIFHGNHIANNFEVGLRLANGSSNNRVCHNNFIDNGEQIQIISSMGTMLDNGYPAGGNFWSDHGTVDRYCGAEQTMEGSDGISDIPFEAAPQVKDRYPFTSYWYPPQVTVSNFSMTGSGSQSSLILGIGMPSDIKVTLNNQRSYLAACIVTMSANSIDIGAFVLELKPEEVRYLSVQFNTSGYEFGNYSICVSLQITSDECYLIEDVTYGGSLFVTLMGDVDGNRVVDIYDIVLMCSCYETRVDDPGYIYSYDLDSNALIDIFDLVLAASSYGEIW